jgi:predicted HAD superfamily Cof-like phosphohydrolase
MGRFQSSVREFHEKIGATVQEIAGPVSPEDRQLRRRLILEEWTETLVAVHEGQNKELIADGLCDTLYVLYGTAVTYGYQVDSETLLGAPVRYRGVDLPLMVIEQMTCEITLTIADLFDRMRTNNSPSIALWKAIRLVADFGYCYQFPMDTLFAEVHRSNMTKGKLNEHSKGGKGQKGTEFVPANIKGILAAAERGEVKR